VSTIRAREAAVQDSEDSVYKMHEKDLEHSEDKMREGWEMEDRRWKMEDGSWKIGGGFGRSAAGSPMASHPLRRRAYGGQANPPSVERRKGEEGLRGDRWC